MEPTTALTIAALVLLVLLNGTLGVLLQVRADAADESAAKRAAPNASETRLAVLEAQVATLRAEVEWLRLQTPRAVASPLVDDDVRLDFSRAAAGPGLRLAARDGHLVEG